MFDLTFAQLLIVYLFVALVLVSGFTRILYHHDVSFSYLNDEGAEMVQFYTLTLDNEISWLVLREAAGAYLDQTKLPHISGSEVIIGHNTVALKRVYHPFWKDPIHTAQKFSDFKQV